MEVLNSCFRFSTAAACERASPAAIAEAMESVTYTRTRTHTHTHRQAGTRAGGNEDRKKAQQLIRDG